MSMDKFFQILSYAPIQRALIAGILVSLCAAILGVILVLKKHSLIGHGLADVGFASLSLALAVGASPLYFSMPIIIASSFIIMYISQNKKVNGDVAIGMFSTGALAIGVIITSLTRGFNMDVYNYMFGSILAIKPDDLILSIILSIVVLVLFIVFYNRLFLITVDETFAKACGVNVTLYQFLISFLTALTVVLGMRMIGTLLISSLIIFPAIIAKKLVSSFKHLVILSAFISVICFLIGMISSFVLNLPTGPSIVAVNIVMLVAVSIVCMFIKRKVA